MDQKSEGCSGTYFVCCASWTIVNDSMAGFTYTSLGSDDSSFL